MILEPGLVPVLPPPHWDMSGQQPSHQTASPSTKQNLSIDLILQVMPSYTIQTWAIPYFFKDTEILFEANDESLLHLNKFMCDSLFIC